MDSIDWDRMAANRLDTAKYPDHAVAALGAIWRCCRGDSNRGSAKDYLAWKKECPRDHANWLRSISDGSPVHTAVVKSGLDPKDTQQIVDLCGLARDVESPVAMAVAAQLLANVAVEFDPSEMGDDVTESEVADMMTGMPAEISIPDLTAALNRVKHMSKKELQKLISGSG